MLNDAVNHVHPGGKCIMIRYVSRWDIIMRAYTMEPTGSGY